ncbi:enoyl-CoA hydratase/isomerase family protein (plasmid) [Sulfitobacter sp. W027]|uniref:oxepin-CoA hydrolase, alternative type n=1 Tax=Sulfitobacter sp. W027 TaxID=2867025 RepID=UPI0021A2D350|nr:enoyl-CoA hydratase-related protein [Sulfitobacter sp. W027]UWR35811.1 enoyl-CoA hydratase/isomerase family protein [Sulfitobacter sp. W027]
MTTVIKSSLSGGVLTLTMAGTKTKNSIGRTQYEALAAAFVDAAHDSAVGAIVITGEGGFFSSGGNVRGLEQSRLSPRSEVAKNTDSLFAMIMALRNCPKPVIAAIEGGAAGLGLSLALSCDMAVASAEAQFTAAYVKIGLTPDGGATYFLREALPRQLVSEMCMLGRPISAERLFAAGALNEITAPGAALDAGIALAKACAAGARDAIGTIKAEIAVAGQAALSDQMDYEGRMINAYRYGNEAGEGLAAFLEKRKPNFNGGAA